MRTHDWDIGEVIHGFAQGSYGRDSYSCRRVEAVGHDWVLSRNELGEVECASGDRIPSREAGKDMSYCGHGQMEPPEPPW